jgi:hypothetical protein
MKLNVTLANATLAVVLASLSVQQVAACGAIAFNPDKQTWGRATGYSDLGDAMNHAISDCKVGCGIYAWTCDAQVAAIVYQGLQWATSTGATADDAIAAAKANCANCTGYVTAGSN